MGSWSQSRRMLGLSLAALLVSCAPEPEPLTEVEDSSVEIDADGAHRASRATARRNAQITQWLAAQPTTDLELARRGLVAREGRLNIRTADGRPVWQSQAYDFLASDAPPSVNPSLWRQAQLNSLHGLFEVVPGIWQVRGYDLANLSVVAGDEGWIIIDPLTSVETARAALDLVERELGPRPISAVIFTHSHIDHFGGVGALSDALETGDVPVIAPAGFMEAAVSENVLAGIVMGRRAEYMYGAPLPRTARGHVGSGLGKHPALGTHTIAEPTILIDRTGQTLEIDGVRMEFQYAPDTEAPAELTILFPDLAAWCGAELVSRNLHNLYTLRGAQVRDALAWSSGIEEARSMIEGRASVMFNSHHWPLWGEAEVQDFLVAQRDVYKYIHDQTLHLAARGLTPDEIAETLELPERLADRFAVRGYYGTVRHNARAVYQRYFGWYDGVPAHLDPLPRTQAAGHYVTAVGGLDAVLEQAGTALDAGDARWAAELAQHAVFAEPDSDTARDLLARAYEQLGYVAESAPWRDVYLTGARELRHGIVREDAMEAGADILDAIPLDMFFAAMATRLDGISAAEQDRVLNFVFTDVGETHVITLSNGVLHHARRDPVAGADATVRLTRAFWMRLLRQEAGLLDMVASGEFAVEGDRRALYGFFALLEQPEPGFAIVTP